MQHVTRKSFDPTTPLSNHTNVYGTSVAHPVGSLLMQDRILNLLL